MTGPSRARTNNCVLHRITRKVEVDPESGCWRFTGVKSDGYGRVHLGDGMVMAHRVMYESLIGPVPEGHDLDHVRARGCVHRDCCNPFHLEPVTRLENLLRGNTSVAAHAAQRDCGYPGCNSCKRFRRAS